MIIDILGINFSGKSEIIRKLKKYNNKYIHIDINQYPHKSLKNKLNIFNVNSVELLRVLFFLLLYRKFYLIKRLLHFYEWHVLYKNKDCKEVAIRDEGLIKKFIEAIPLNPSAKEIFFWLNFFEKNTLNLLKISYKNSDKLILIDISKDVFIKRAQYRLVCDLEGHLNRYLLYRECCEIIFLKAIKNNYKISRLNNNYDDLDIDLIVDKIFN